MNWDTVKGDWKQFSGKIKTQWGKLTDDELTQINGNREQLEGKIQARYGYDPYGQTVLKQGLDGKHDGRHRRFA